jgi:hypothetical protein
VGKCQYPLDAKLAASAETRPNLPERRNVPPFDARWKTVSRVDQAEQRAEQGEHRPDLRILVTLRCYVAAECLSLYAPLHQCFSVGGPRVVFKGYTSYVDCSHWNIEFFLVMVYKAGKTAQELDGNAETAHEPVVLFHRSKNLCSPMKDHITLSRTFSTLIYYTTLRNYRTDT